jgi:ACS family hexuronate transporter-like MFS transporter
MIFVKMDFENIDEDVGNPFHGRPTGRPRVRWIVCALVFAATTINYMDREVMGLLAPVLQTVLKWSEAQYGYIIMSFQIAYAIGYVTSGRILDAIGTRLGYAGAVLLWSIASCLHALVGTVVGFAVVRFLLGLGESGNFPAAIKSTVDYFPAEERALATGLLNSGMNIAVQITPLFVPWVVLRWGWHAAFLATGLLGFLWLVVWMAFPYDRLRPKVLVPPQSDSGSVWLLLRVRCTWAFTIAKFLTDTIWWFYLYWLPKFFSSRFGLNIGAMALPLTVVYLAASAGSIGGGGLAGLLIRARGSLNFGRKMAMLICALCALPVMAVPAIRHLWWATALIALAAGAHQGWSANLFTTPADMFPARKVATVVGIGGTAGALGGVLLSWAAGQLLQKTHDYKWLFVVSGSVYLFSLLWFQMMVPRLHNVSDPVSNLAGAGD